MSPLLKLALPGLLLFTLMSASPFGAAARTAPPAPAPGVARELAR